MALVEAARSILVRCALIEIAKARSPELFEDRLPYGFGVEAVTALQRYGIPFKGLLKLVGQDVPDARATDAYFVEIQEMSRSQLDRRFEALKREGVDVLRRFTTLRGTEPGPATTEASAPLAVQWFASMSGPRR